MIDVCNLPTQSSDLISRASAGLDMFQFAIQILISLSLMKQKEIQCLSA